MLESSSLTVSDPLPMGAMPEAHGRNFPLPWREWRLRLRELIDRFLPGGIRDDAEAARRGRLITRFGLLGFIFGMAYAGFYLLIGHHWGVAIIVACSFAFLAAPFLMKALSSLPLAGNLLTGVMAAGFTGLCFVEGGMEGHAMAWLISVPLCGLLLVGPSAARVWAVLSVLAGSTVAAFGLAGIRVPVRYDLAWHPIVTAAGYLGLILFLFLLGVIFESGRLRALERMREALVKLETSNEKLVHLNNEKNEFLSIAAHDLKNPLTVIIGNAELVQMVDDPAVIHRVSGNILTAGIRMRTLIKDLLDANAIEEGRMTSKIEECPLAALVEQCLEHNRDAALKKDIAIRTAFDEEAVAMADRSATAQILDNLISNSIKYSPPGKRVHVTVGRSEGRAFVSVRDEGPGISAEDQKKLFQKFTRLTARPTGGESSNGLGLSIVKRLAEAMKGSVSCASVLGEGATFTVALPACPPPANPRPQAAFPNQASGCLN